MKNLYLTQFGPKIGNIGYGEITTEKENSCALTNLDGTKHNWSRRYVWLILSEEAQKYWKGQTRQGKQFMWGLLQ